MAGKFVNTQTTYQQMPGLAAETVKQRLNNPYYIFPDKKPTECTYYNLNTTKTTIDEATKGNYAEISAKSPLRFNKIKNFLIYGFSRIEPQLDVGEYGLEGNEITGEAFILPNTIIPYPGDYFTLVQITKPLIFKINGVNPNTLDSGSTMYRITYELISSDGFLDIEPQVTRTFKFTLNTGGNGSSNGTNIATNIVDEEVYNNALSLQECATKLKDIYISLFYDTAVQSFVYNTTQFSDNWYKANGAENKYVGRANMQRVDNPNPFGIMVYDPYLIEFIIRNKILTGASDYIYVEHQMYMPITFSIDYARTFFSSLEDKDIDKHYGWSVGNILLCEQHHSLLYAFPRDYYYMKYGNVTASFFSISIFDNPDFKNNIKNNQLTSNILHNLVVKYFNGETIDTGYLKNLDHLDYQADRVFYYAIPMAIFCIEKQIEANMDGSEGYETIPIGHNTINKITEVIVK